MEELAELVARWDLEGHKPHHDPHYNDIHKLLNFYEQYYSQYIPTLGSEHHDYERRLKDWVGNVGDEAIQRTLLELAPRILFFSRDDFTKLHQAALHGPIMRWIVDELGLQFGQPDFNAKLETEIYSHTWFCPITDSMQISDFHHANNIGGIDYRPDWRSLAQFGDNNRIIDFMRNHTIAGKATPLKRIVLLEDFIGSATQVMDAVDFAVTLDPSVPLLLLPLIICPAGANVCRSLASKYRGILWFDSIIELTDDDMITASIPRDGSLREAVADISRSIYSNVVGDGSSAPRPYGPFGFPPPDGTGATIVLYSNTPANTLPIIQHSSNTWKPLFPRSARIR